MSHSDVTATTQIDPQRDRSPGSTQLTRTNQTHLLDWHFKPNDSQSLPDPALVRFLSRLGTDQDLHTDGDLITGSSSYGHSDSEPDLKAVAAPHTLFCSSETITAFANRFPAAAWKSIILQYYLQYDDGVMPRIQGLDKRCNDARGLLSHHHKWARCPWDSCSWDSNLRAILPGLLVIDCFSKQVVAASPSCSYVALSYVWGCDGEEQGFKTDLSDHRLPRTILDAMNVVRVLGMNYLWVDRYCINSTEPGTKHHTISNMDAIYEAAYLTIIAATGNDGEYGLPSVSRTVRALAEELIPPWNGIVFSEFSGPHLRQFQNSTYSTRAWTFQEDLLSRRRLIFTNDRATLYYGEEDRISTSSDIFAHINEYSRRRLTYPADLLKAFLGIFRAYERLQPPVKHTWGIPFLLDCKHNIRQPGDGLLWRANHTCSLHRIEELPSWSWAGWNGWSTHDIEDGYIVSREFPLGPYRWFLEKVHLRHGTPAREPSDISLEVKVGTQLTDISDHFHANHGLQPSIKGGEPMPVLYMTAWSTTVNVCISLSGIVRSADKDLNAAKFTIDPTPETLHKGEPLINEHWCCQWTAAVVCWGARKGDARPLRTQSLLLERVGEGAFRRVGVLETGWHKPDLDEHGRMEALDRSFARTCCPIE